MTQHRDYTADSMDHIELLYRIFWRRRHPVDMHYWSSLANGFSQIQAHLNRTIRLHFKPTLVRNPCP